MSVERHRTRGMLPSFMLGLSTFPWRGVSTGAGTDVAWRNPPLDRLHQLDC